MSLNFNQEIWIIVERLYIHVYSTDEFKIFLKKFGLDYTSELYDNFNYILYTFMSEPHYDFANFMQTVPTYKYLPILEKIIFDEKIIATRKDGWNYYGNYIKNWHPEIIKILKSSNIVIDSDFKKLIHEEVDEVFEGPDFLPYQFGDLFLDYIRKEINESYANGQMLATIILSRKLLEALTIRIMEVVFPKKNVAVEYLEENHLLWYDKLNKRHQSFSVLIKNLKSKSEEFHEDEDLIKKLCKDMNRMRIKANSYVHRDYKIPNEEIVSSLKIELSVEGIRKIYKKYCNP